jgi:iron complex transport system ATP-binding protein
MEKMNSHSFFEGNEIVLGYPGARPLNHQPFSFQVPHLAITALVGLNGSGKSTLIHGLIGERVVLQGQLKCFDKPINSFSSRELSELIAIVPQETVFPGSLKVRHLLSFSQLGRAGLFGKLPTFDATSIPHIVSELELTRLLDKRLGEISSGERQRVFLARAILQDSKIIALDEPTNHLDLRTSKAFWNSLLKAKTLKPVDILISTHDLNFVKEQCDWVLALSEGQLLFNGNKNTFFEQKWNEKFY